VLLARGSRWSGLGSSCERTGLERAHDVDNAFRQNPDAGEDEQCERSFLRRTRPQVRPVDEARREDADIRGVALQALMWDVEVPAESIDVKVENGWITLKGSVGDQYESDAAYDDVASLYGVYGITNEIKVDSL
jgi:hypothetical protein